MLVTCGVLVYPGAALDPVAFPHTLSAAALARVAVTAPVDAELESKTLSPVNDVTPELPPLYCGTLSVLVACVYVAAPLDPMVVSVIGRFVILAALIVGAETKPTVQVPVVVTVHVPDTAVWLVVPAIVMLVTVPAPELLTTVQVPFTPPVICPFV